MAEFMLVDLGNIPTVSESVNLHINEIQDRILSFKLSASEENKVTEQDIKADIDKICDAAAQLIPFPSGTNVMVGMMCIYSLYCTATESLKFLDTQISKLRSLGIDVSSSVADRERAKNTVNADISMYQDCLMVLGLWRLIHDDCYEVSEYKVVMPTLEENNE